MSRIEVGAVAGTDNGDNRSTAATPTSTTILVPYREAETTDPAAGSRRGSVEEPQDPQDLSVGADIEAGSRPNMESIYPSTGSNYDLVGNYELNPQRTVPQP